MKKLIFLIIPIFGFAQTNDSYWQQEVQYIMDIEMDVEKHQFEGKQELHYTNNSPDTIYQIFYHLYFNAFQPGSMMDNRAKNIVDPDRRIGRRIEALGPDEIGFHKIKFLKQGKKELQFHIQETLLQAELIEPIPPGESTVFSMKFNSQVPVQIRRSGRHNKEGVDYTMTQWYPKLAEYDADGWHPDPYVGREFYGVFGSFEVNISIDYRYKIGGTGTLQNSESKWTVLAEKEGLKSYELSSNKKKMRSWKFKAENVHDFAWAADPDFIRTSVMGPKNTELNFYYLPGDWQENWELLPSYTQSFFENMNRLFGEYAYPQFSVIQGGDGGMEYPMCTMLKGTGKLNGLIGVMVHESAHNWYYGMLASNEFQYPWMDEGFTSYAEEEVLNIILEHNKANPHERAYLNHNYYMGLPDKEPLSTPGDYFEKNRHYGISAYSRGEVFVAQLKNIVGDESFSRIMLRYFEEWKFKHPKPQDFLKIAEEESGIQLDWYLNFWMNSNKEIDYAIMNIEEGKDMFSINLQRLGEMPIPLDIRVELKNGHIKTYNIPLLSMFGNKNEKDMILSKAWPWTSINYQLLVDLDYKDVERIIIDPGQWVADINRANNVWPQPEVETEEEETEETED
tara:strand:+ start:70560 stop:72425 length:1866 start_codon:yes stop_codon:yes gene_type:complete